MTSQPDHILSLRSAQDILDSSMLRAHYQPIVQFKDGKVVAHESLIRLPGNSALLNPDEFFRAARAEGLTVKAEQACLDEGIRSRGARRPDTRLFLNLSAFALIRDGGSPHRARRHDRRRGATHAHADGRQWTGLGRSTIYPLIAEHKFPAPIALATRAVAWRRADLEDWSERRPHAAH